MKVCVYRRVTTRTSDAGGITEAFFSCTDVLQINPQYLLGYAEN